MLDLLIVTMVAFLLYCILVLRSVGVLNANGIFCVLQMVMASGTFPILEPTNAADRTYAYIVTWATISYMTVSGCILLHKPPMIRQGGRWTPRAEAIRCYVPGPPVGTLVGISIAIVTLYFVAVGNIALLEGLLNSFKGGDADIAGTRLAAYAGQRYLFPGYVNQFRNLLLPALVTVVLTYWRFRRHPHILLTIGLVGFTTIGILATGQRGAFIQFCVVLLVYMYLINNHKLPRITLYISAAALLLVLVSTIALGRSNSQLTSTASPIDRLWVAFVEFQRRVFSEQQISAVAGFRYIYAQPIQWGNEWWRGLAGVLPGQGGSDLSNQIFASLYGSSRGTSPPSIWGSTYHNFGWAGALLMPVVLAVILSAVTRTAARPRSRNTLQIIGIAGISTTLGFWVAGSPDSLLNTGLVVYILLWWFGARANHHPQPNFMLNGRDTAPKQTSFDTRSLV